MILLGNNDTDNACCIICFGISTGNCFIRHEIHDFRDFVYFFHFLQCWLDHDKQILRQVSHHSLDFQFVVKFYTPDPGLLEEEYTRYYTV